MYCVTRKIGKTHKEFLETWNLFSWIFPWLKNYFRKSGDNLRGQLGLKRKDCNVENFQRYSVSLVNGVWLLIILHGSGICWESLAGFRYSLGHQMRHHNPLTRNFMVSAAKNILACHLQSFVFVWWVSRINNRNSMAQSRGTLIYSVHVFLDLSAC